MYFYITHRLKYKMIEEEKDMWWLLISAQSMYYLCNSLPVVEK